LARDHVVSTDLVICCTDTNHSRTAVSEFPFRYLVPAIDLGVVFESKNGLMTGEVGRITIYSPGAPCASAGAARIIRTARRPSDRLGTPAGQGETQQAARLQPRRSSLPQKAKSLLA